LETGGERQMTVERWLAAAIGDVRARGLDGTVPVLEAFAQAMTTLRAADWNAGLVLPSDQPLAADGASDDGNSTPTAVRDPTETNAPVPPPRPRRSTSDHPHTLEISEASERIRQRTLTSLALTESCLEQIDRLNPGLNAFITVTRDEALATARAADADIARGEWRGPLHGIPISLKDLIDQRGVATTAGSRVPQPGEATQDAPVTAALRHAGAVLIGKTNLHEFAFGTTSDESAFGPVRHPLDRERSPGGSSGGSAVAVATGMSLASIGTDTGGSIRIPSAACGLVGLKPGAGDLSCVGIVPLSHTLDHVGPMARTVTDAAIVYRALSGHPMQPLTAPAVDRLRIGVLREYFEEMLEPDVHAAVVRMQQRLRAAGATLVDVRLPHAPHIAAVYLAIVFGEAAVVHAAGLERYPDHYQPGVRLRLEAARFVLAEDYLHAMRGRDAIRMDVDRALDGCDVLLAPALAIQAPPIGAGIVSIAGTPHPVRNLMLRLTQPFNISGHPAVTVPCGRTTPGLPCAVQLIGRRGGTLPLLGAALACEPYGIRGVPG
jgi:aspartyl-tRNA(Asn)/glutamyl-tRNA(Gln) amidotransferase subunit A